MTETPKSTRLTEALEELLALSRTERDTGTSSRPDSPWARAFRRRSSEDTV